MHNTIALDLYLVGTGALVIAIMVWVLADGLRTGKLPLKGGATADRRRQPAGFWFLAGLMSVVLCGVCLGYGSAFADLIWR